MAVIAPMGKYRKHSFMIYIFVCLGFAAWFTYDGYFSQKFIESHTIDGMPDATLKANRYGPYVLVVIAALLGLRWWMVKDKKVVADGKALIFDDGVRIEYSSIEKIDKTQFDKKGSFIITYKDSSGRQINRTLCDKNWDNLDSILNELVTALKGGAAS